MGIFSESSPAAAPSSQRRDVAPILSAAPSRECDRLSSVQLEIDYLERVLPREEEVLAVATAQATGMGIALGVVALTPRRLVAVLGPRNHGRAGTPTVTVTELRRIQHLGFGSKHVRGVRGYFATFALEGREEFIMDIGQDDNWADFFLSRVQKQINEAKSV